MAAFTAMHLKRICKLSDQLLSLSDKGFLTHRPLVRTHADMESGSLQSTHVGRDGLTPDQRAVIDQAGPDGFYIACGFSGTGFKLSPAVGVCVSELILDGKSKLVDVSSLNLGRFARGEFLQGDHSYGHIWK